MTRPSGRHVRRGGHAQDASTDPATVTLGAGADAPAEPEPETPPAEPKPSKS